MSLKGNAGMIEGNVGLGFDTGARIGINGVEGKFLGCGGMIDKDKGIGISFFGNSLNVKPW